MKYLPESGYKRVAVICLYVVIGLLSAYVFFNYVLKLILPFVIAWIVAMFIQPLINKINKRTRLPRKLLSIIFVLLSLAAIGFAIFLILNRIFYETRNLLKLLNDNADSVINGVFDFVESLYSKIPLLDSLADGDYLSGVTADLFKNAISAISSNIPNWIAALIGALPSAIFFSVILVMASFYICADFKEINSMVARQFPLRAAEIFREVKKHFISTGFQYLKAYLLMISITFIQLLVGFYIIGIEYAFTIALFAAVVDVLPVLGVGTVLIPWSGILLIQGDYYTGFGLLIIYGIVAVVRQFAEPKIVGGSIGLSPLITLIAMYSGYKIFGFIGMFIMPVLAILLKNLNDSGTVKIWNKAAQ